MIYNMWYPRDFYLHSSFISAGWLILWASSASTFSLTETNPLNSSASPISCTFALNTSNLEFPFSLGSPGPIFVLFTSWPTAQFAYPVLLVSHGCFPGSTSVIGTLESIGDREDADWYMSVSFWGRVPNRSSEGDLSTESCERRCSARRRWAVDARRARVKSRLRRRCYMYITRLESGG